MSSDTFSAVGVGTVFTPIAGFDFSVASRASADFVGSFQLEKLYAGDSNWYLAYPYSMLTALPETFDLRSGGGASFRWNCTALTTGTVTARISQQ